MISHRVGKGSIAYLGAVLDSSLMRTILQTLTADAMVHPEFISLPDNVELCRRVGKVRTVYILINHGLIPAEIVLPVALKDVLHDLQSITKVTLDPQGVAVLESDSN